MADKPSSLRPLVLIGSALIVLPVGLLKLLMAIDWTDMVAPTGPGALVFIALYATYPTLVFVGLVILSYATVKFALRRFRPGARP